MHLFSDSEYKRWEWASILPNRGPRGAGCLSGTAEWLTLKHFQSSRANTSRFHVPDSARIFFLKAFSAQCWRHELASNFSEICHLLTPDSLSCSTGSAKCNEHRSNCTVILLDTNLPKINNVTWDAKDKLDGEQTWDAKDRLDGDQVMSQDAKDKLDGEHKVKEKVQSQW